MQSKAEPRGQLLAEVLIAMAFVTVIIAAGTQLFLVGGTSSKSSTERNVAQGLIQETLDAARTVAESRWLNIYKPPSGSGDPSASKGSSNHYYTQISGSSWALLSGNENVTMNGIQYTRYFYIENVSRDPTTRAIEYSYNASNDDPSTQKITIVVSWQGAAPITVSEFITRWRNRVCVQTNWNGGASASVVTCPTTMFGSAQSGIDTGASGTVKLLSQ